MSETAPHLKLVDDSNSANPLDEKQTRKNRDIILETLGAPQTPSGSGLSPRGIGLHVGEPRVLHPSTHHTEATEKK